MATGGNQQTSTMFDKEGLLYTENFGGINTELSPTDLPLGDSPEMMNMEITPNGSLRKRRGTYLRVSHTTSGFRKGQGHVIIPHKLKQGHVVILEKLEGNLRIGLLHPEIDEPNVVSGSTGVANIALFTSVWSSRANSIRPSWVITPDPIPRCLLATSQNTVVEVMLNELQVDTQSNFVGSISITDNLTVYPRFFDGTLAQMVLINNSTGLIEKTVTTTAYAGTGTQVTINFAGTLNAGSYTLFRPVWFHWGEAEGFAPDQLYDTVLEPVRGYNGVDHFPAFAIEVPEALRRSIDLNNANTNGDKSYVVYSDTASPSTLMVFTQTPGSNNTHLAYSNGTSSQAPGNYVQSGSTHLVLGRTGGAVALPARLLHMVRFYNSKLNGDGGLESRYVEGLNNAYGISPINRRINMNNAFGVSDQPVAGTQNWFTANQQFYRGRDINFTAITSVFGTTMKWYGMNGSIPFGIHNGNMFWCNRFDYGAGGSVEHIGQARANAADHYGTGVTVLEIGDRLTDKNGYMLPHAGLHEVCNFSFSYDFPGIISYFQGRVVITGLFNSPNVIAFSNVTNNYEFGVYNFERGVNRSFDTLYTDPGLGYNPFQVFLDIDQSDSITAVIPTNESLVVFTRNATYVISGVNGANVIPTAYVQNKIANVGCVNSSSVVNTELGIVFLSENGVYILKPDDTSSSYSVINLSLKIQEVFRKAKMINTPAWISYDNTRSEIYIGLPDGVYNTNCVRLMVLNLVRNAWTEYSLQGGYWQGNYGTCIGGRILLDSNYWDDRTTGADSVNASINILELGAERYYLDWIKQEAGNSFGASYASPGFNYSNFLGIDAAQTNYSTLIEDIPTEYTAVKPIPIRQVVESKWHNTTTATDLKDYRFCEVNDFSDFEVDKTPWGGFVIDNFTLTTGNNLRVRNVQYNTQTTFPIHIWVNNVKLTQTTDYTIVDSSTRYAITPVASYTSNDVVVLGQAYPCWWLSPMFTRQRIELGKKATHTILQFRNDKNQLFKASDRNTAAGQAASAISDKFKITENCSFALLYDSSFDSTYATDIYQLTDNLFTFGTDMNKTRREEISKIVLPCVGFSDTLQIAVFNFDETYFNMTAYQLVTQQKGKSARSYQDLR